MSAPKKIENAHLHSPKNEHTLIGQPIAIEAPAEMPSAAPVSSPGTNKLGLTKDDYKGSKSTLCTGCGHDSISSTINAAFFQANIDPFKVAKMSGIGCSSKTPAYFIGKSHALNAVHGRMPSASTGTKIANQELSLIGISGDGDTASIGIGGFIHMIRRNLPIAYIIANNGVYGLTKGQFSATSERGAKLKSGETNPFETIDLCALAIELGCSFVARSFSGDTKHLIPLIAAAMKHNGTAVIDIISPCVTFNNQPDSRKSYDYIKEHKVTLQELGYIEGQDEIKIDLAEGNVKDIQLPDGSHLRVRKLHSESHDITDADTALQVLRKARNSSEILTGLFYVNPNTTSFIETLDLTPTPLCHLTEKETRPSSHQLSEILTEFR